MRGGYASGAFWGSERDRKLEHIAGHRREWAWMHAAWIPLLAVVTAGFVAFALLLAVAGENALAGIGLGLFLVGVLGWVVGVFLQASSGHVAARIRSETGVAPAWLEPVWAAIGWAEVSYVALAQGAYVVWGSAMVDSGFPAARAGWAAIVLGAASLVGIALAPRQLTFPELPLLVPIVVGVALLLV